MTLIKHPKRPAHLFLDNTTYFITASIWKHRKLLDDDLKTQLQSLLHDVLSQYGWQLDHWVILDDHYHLLCKSKQGRDLPKILSKIHSLSSKAIKAKHAIDGRIWVNYWDYCPRDDRDSAIRLCYLLNNPYKHDYVKDLHDWKWSSFHSYYEKMGKLELQGLFREHADYRKLVLGEEPL